MNTEIFQQPLQDDSDNCPCNEYDLDEYCENHHDELIETDETDETTTIVDLTTVSNDDFLTAIFGNTFSNAHPLVCKKSGDPDAGGWAATQWPCNTGDATKNWYCQPSLYTQDDMGKYRAKKELVVSIHAVMLDDIGTKVSFEKINNFPPSWLIETSPGNYQAGYIFSKPITEISLVEQLKEKLVESGLCDMGSTGAAARWMRMPVAINGRPKYGNPSPNCRLTIWEPHRRYTINELYVRLNSAKSLPSDLGQNEAQENEDRSNNLSKSATKHNIVVEALHLKGLYKQPLGDAKHDISCPWVEQHTDQADNGTAYFEPSAQYPLGGFKCHHSHGNLFHIKDLLNFLQISPTVLKDKPHISVDAGKLDSICDDAEKELAASGTYFQRGNLIATVNTTPENNKTAILCLSQPSLLRALSHLVLWTRHSEKKGDFVCDPPSRHVTVLFNAQSYRHLPPLIGVAHQPYLRDDYSLICTPGYDPNTRMFGVFDQKKFPIVDLATKAEAQAALNELLALLSEFDFSDDCDRSAALSAMFTAALRPSISVAPMFHIKAHQIASGKSYLSSIIAAFGSNTGSSAIAFPTTEDECQKLLLASLIEAPACIIFDNLTTDLLPFKTLCSALTEEYITGRILGMSKTATVSTRTLFLSSGNNVGPVRDMTRRCLTICLDPKIDMPAARDFKTDSLKLIRDNREKFVSLVLTIVRGWVMAGKPEISVKPVASYEHWGSIVRQPLLWLGMPDPAERLFEQIANDPDRELLSRILQAWSDNFDDSPTTIREAVKHSTTRPYGDLDTPKKIELNEVLREIAEERGEINRRRLGKWISRKQGYVVNGQRFEKQTGKSSVEKWLVKSV